MKPGLAILAILSAVGLLASGGEARENRVLKCKISRARALPAGAGPALLANAPGAMTPISLDAVQMTDKKIAKQVLVEALFARRTEADTVEVTARLVNCTNKPVQVDARASFLDVDQFPTEQTSAWQRVFLPPYATGVYRENSVGREQVANYLIELRGAEQRQSR